MKTPTIKKSCDASPAQHNGSIHNLKHGIEKECPD